jgi:putative serine protease PepD
MPSVTQVSGGPTLELASLADVAAKVQPSVVSIRAGQGEGSGVILSADGAILTNNHVVADAEGETLEVSFSSGKVAQATVVGTDPAGDLAVIKAKDVSGLTPATFGDSNLLRIGDTVLALGSPLGLEGSVTEGIVSALHRTIAAGGQSNSGRTSIGDVIQTDAAINPGNSGGALVNLNGEVIGINTAIATSGEGSGNIGVGFAIPSSKAKAAADQLLKGDKVSHPYIGVRLADGSGGALISDVVEGGPAEKAGLRKGDLVVQAGSYKVTNSNTFIAAVQTTKPGDQLALRVMRNESEEHLTVTVGESS